MAGLNLEQRPIASLSLVATLAAVLIGAVALDVPVRSTSSVDAGQAVAQPEGAARAPRIHEKREAAPNATSTLAPEHDQPVDLVRLRMVPPRNQPPSQP